MMLVAAIMGAIDFVMNEAIPEIREAWKHPEGTRWGSKKP
jgi:hypothetical protein